jgi:hypothetical protein
VCAHIHDSQGFLHTPDDRAVAELAARQHGIVSHAQLRAAGFGQGAIEHRVRRGRLHPLHRGVYAVGHARVTWRGHLWSAVLATGGVLSHRSAAAVWELLPAPSGRIEVTTRRAAHSTPALRVHRSRNLDGVVHHDGLPTTTVARTLVDLGDVLSPHRLTRVCHRAEVLRLLDARAMQALLETLPGRRSHNLRAALSTLAAADPIITRSELEERFLALIARHGLPTPLVNLRVEGYEVDFAWPKERVLVETDGGAAHDRPLPSRTTAAATSPSRSRDTAHCASPITT